MNNSQPWRTVRYDFLLTFHSNHMGLSRTVSKIEGDFSRNSQIFPIPLVSYPRWRGSPWNWVSALGVKKLQWWGYRVDKGVWRYLQTSGQNERTWTTKRPTDRRTPGHSKDRAYAYCRAVKIDIKAKVKSLIPNLSKKAKKVPNCQIKIFKTKRLQKGQIWLIWLCARPNGNATLKLYSVICLGTYRYEGSYSRKQIVLTIEQRSCDLRRRYDTTSVLLASLMFYISIEKLPLGTHQNWSF